MRGFITRLMLLLLLGGAASLAIRYAERHYPHYLPWTPLDLDQPIGPFTGRKLTALHDKPRQCSLLIDQAGVEHRDLPVRTAGPHCGYDNAVLLQSGQGRAIDYVPRAPAIACPVAAALILWERQMVQPAARRHLGSPVSSIRHFGSYACRRLYGGEEGGWSEHARANAIDIGAFDLADGRRISVAAHWQAGDPDAQAFLREVRDGACRLFSTVLGPDYNPAHQDHYHLDQAARRWRMCR